MSMCASDKVTKPLINSDVINFIFRVSLELSSFNIFIVDA